MQFDHIKFKSLLEECRDQRQSGKKRPHRAAALKAPCGTLGPRRRARGCERRAQEGEEPKVRSLTVGQKGAGPGPGRPGGVSAPQPSDAPAPGPGVGPDTVPGQTCRDRQAGPTVASLTPAEHSGRRPWPSTIGRAAGAVPSGRGAWAASARVGRSSARHPARSQKHVHRGGLLPGKGVSRAVGGGRPRAGSRDVLPGRLVLSTGFSKSVLLPKSDVDKDSQS